MGFPVMELGLHGRKGHVLAWLRHELILTACDCFRPDIPADRSEPY